MDKWTISKVQALLNLYVTKKIVLGQASQGGSASQQVPRTAWSESAYRRC